jgi:hypothetical protein
MGVTTNAKRARIGVPAALVIAGLLLAPAPAGAETQAERALQKILTERKIRKLEERIERVAILEPTTDASLELARRHAVLARKLLSFNNTRASKAVLDLAERHLSALESKEGSE